MATLWIRRKWSGRSIAPTQVATHVTSGVASTQPVIATAKIIRYTFEMRKSTVLLVFRDSAGASGPQRSVRGKLTGLSEYHASVDSGQGGFTSGLIICSRRLARSHFLRFARFTLRFSLCTTRDAHLSGRNEAERAALLYGTELTRDKKVNPDTFASMSRHYSERAICEIVWLVASEH